MDKFATAPNLDQLLAIKADELTTLIDAGVVIEGILRVTHGKSVLISGEVRGAIESNGSVVINEGATVVGSIRSKSLQVSGKVLSGKEGDVMDIEGPIVLVKSAVVACDAISDGVKAAFGAVMTGLFRPREAKRPAAPRGRGRGPPILRRENEHVKPIGAMLQAVSTSHAEERHVG